MTATQTFALAPEVAQQLRDASAQHEESKEKVRQAKEAVRAAENALDEKAGALSEAESGAAKALIRAWIRAKLFGKTLREQQDFADWLSVQRADVCSPLVGQVVKEAFAGHIELFSRPQTQAWEASELVHSLVKNNLDEVLQENFCFVAPIWRAGCECDDYWKQREREDELRRLCYQHPPRLVVPVVCDALLKAGRIKDNCSLWWRASRCSHSFRNQGTVEADIAKAVEAASVLWEARQAYPWAA